MFLSTLKKSLLLTLLFLLSALAGGEFRIAATTDIHGNLRNFARLYPKIRAAAPDITIDAGDLTGGSMVAELDSGKAMIAALNMAKYTFRVPGNHDFYMPYVDFQAQHISFKGTTLGGDWSWKNTAGVPYAIVSKGAFKVGVIGLTEPNINRRHLPLTDGPRFIKWRKALLRALDSLRREKVHFTILVWHNGIETPTFGAKESLSDIGGIDLVIGGHSHKEYLGESGEGIFFVQPGAYGKAAALVTVRYNDTTLKVEKAESRLLRGSGDHGDREMTALDRRTFKALGGMIGKKVCRKGDLSLRNFPRLGAQALKEAGHTQGAVFVPMRPGKEMENYSMFKDLYRLTPFWSTLCTVTLRKGELQELLEDLDRNNPQFKRVTGVAGFQWSPGKKNLPGNITLTVSTYLMVSSPVLRKILQEPVKRWHHLDIPEREAVERFLQKRVYSFTR